MLKKFGSALIGFFLFPLAEIISRIINVLKAARWIILNPTLVLNFLFAWLLILGQVWRYHSQEFPLIHPIIIFAISLALTFILTFITVPAALIYSLIYISINICIFPFEILTQCWNGARTGWNKGLSAVLSYAINIIKHDPSEQIFNDLLLDDCEAYSESLTQAERAELKQHPHPAWAAYEKLDALNRSDTANEEDEMGSPGQCCISFEYPVLPKTMLLFKQYKEHRIWKPVPNIANIFDEDSFKNLIKAEVNFQHPLSRDKILNPSVYEGHPTRYRIHPYYSADGKPLSQERHELTLVLRGYLNGLAIAAPAAAQAAEVQQFPSPLDSAVNLEAKRPDSQEGQPQFGA